MKKILFFALFLLIMAGNLTAQDKLYSKTFPLADVQLSDGIFKHAQDLNLQTLLEYDVDRLLAPYLKEAGLTPQGESYSNWIDLDGHIGGHYLSALAIHYAATGNEDCKTRMEYMISELKRCQQAHGNGYAGGVPNGMAIWNSVKNGNPAAVASGWVPWYNVHKMYAGLRDAWNYGGNDDARQMFLDFCDWGLTVIASLSDAQMEQMLDTEFGGMNEVYADAYQMTNDLKYLNVAKRFAHKTLYNSMAQRADNLDNKHANTQVPKAVGYQRVAELTNDASYTTAAGFFWETVVNNRSLSLGGNSRDEHFPAAAACESYTENRNGPESCNTNNMLKLTEGLFRMNPQAKYADFYERALLNHILSTQHPEHGGYVYFTSARPRHYRVYSAPNKGMWCCVGTGMENHGKYGEFIYSSTNDSLYVNLFIASELNWKDKNVTVEQQTDFPDTGNSRLVIKTAAPATFTLLIRHPSWTPASEMSVVCGGVNYASQSLPSSYVAIERTWNDGDVVEIHMQMHTTIEELPNVPEYISVLHGPVLLGARTGNEYLSGLIADEDRWAHIANGPLMPLSDAPFIVGERAKILQQLDQLQAVEDKSLCFTAPDLFKMEKDKSLMFEPFFRIHDSRYMMYWLSMTEKEYLRRKDELEKSEHDKLLLDDRTVDAVAPGEQQPEVDHLMQSTNSYTGFHQEEGWRDARSGGFFSYNLMTQGIEDLYLMVRYWGNESGSRTFDILLDDQLLVTENVTGQWNKNEFVDVEYPIPASMVAGKESITVKFQPKTNHVAGGVFYVRLLSAKTLDTFDLALWITKCETLQDGIQEGTEDGTYPVIAINAFQQVLETAGTFIDNTQTDQASIDNQTALLKAAYQNLLASVNGNPVVIHFQAEPENQVADRTGNNYPASLQNGASSRTMGNYTVLNLGASNGYLDMSAPVGEAISRLNDFSVSAYYYINTATSITGNGNFLWTFSTQETCNQTTGKYIAYRVNTQRYALSTGGWGSEMVGLQTDAAATKGKWQHVLYSQYGTIAKLYLNGELVQEGTAYYTPSEIGATDFNWLGRPQFTSDAYLKNTLIYDFKVYNRTLSEQEIGDLASLTSHLQDAYEGKTAIQTPVNVYPTAWGETGEMFIRKEQENSTVQIYNTLGILLKSPALTDTVTRIRLNQGIYIVEFSPGHSKKVVVK
jgi:DUF1680 family protein